MDPRYQVQQYVAEVQGRFARFRVFRTAAPGWYLFDALDPSGASWGLQFPVRAADLRDDVRRALANGWGT